MTCFHQNDKYTRSSIYSRIIEYIYHCILFSRHASYYAMRVLEIEMLAVIKTFSGQIAPLGLGCVAKYS